MTDLTEPLPGLPPGKVFLRPHDGRWAALFAEEAAVITEALGGAVLAIEHYGSTSIPGIDAKPVIDLLVGLQTLDEALAHRPALEALGYDYASHAGVPGHHVFGKGVARTHLAHFVEYDGAEWRRCLAFRDALRAAPARAAAYEALKRDLAARHPDDRAAYTAGKGAFVAEVLAAVSAS
jgi:GrpB-like predicted nucleotidyltransferase (UPF0157 family)